MKLLLALITAAIFPTTAQTQDSASGIDILVREKHDFHYIMKEQVIFDIMRIDIDYDPKSIGRILKISARCMGMHKTFKMEEIYYSAWAPHLAEKTPAGVDLPDEVKVSFEVSVKPTRTPDHTLEITCGKKEGIAFFVEE